MANKYEQIADDLRRKLATGDLAPGDRLDAEQALAKQYRVSTMTMRAALDALKTEGLLESRQGSGTYVRAPRQRVQRTTDRYQWEKDRARASSEERGTTGASEQDTGLTMQDLEFHAEYEEIPATQDLADQFGVSTGTKLLHRTYRTNPRGLPPLSLVDSYLVFDVVAANPELLSAENEPWPGGTQNQLYTIGIEVGKIVDEVSARIPSAREADLLDLGQGVAILALRKKSYSIDGKLVELSDVALAGDATVATYVTHLKPWEN
jgi:GntR family transcriptional regulator